MYFFVSRQEWCSGRVGMYGKSWSDGEEYQGNILRPSISWLKDGALLDRNAQDGGNYACRASNGYNEAEDRVDITVEDLQVQDSCVDNPYYANCKLIVRAVDQQNIYNKYNYT